MVDGISGVNTGSIKDLPVYQQYYNEYLAYNKSTGSNMSFEAFLSLKGRKSHFLQEVENYLEGGGDGVKANTLSGSRYVNNGNFAIYQSQDEDTYYEFDFSDGSYRVLHGKDEIAQVLGLDGENIDTIKFGYGKVETTDYTFGNLDDGQDSTTSRVNGGIYGGVTYKKQEFDLDYIFNALLMNPNDPQYQIASQIFDDLVANMKQWCPESDLAELDEIAAEYGTNSVQYKTKLKEVLLANLDQANEWIDDHNHVEFKENASFDPTNDTNTDGTNTDGTNGEQQENKVPEYNKYDIFKNDDDYKAGISRKTSNFSKDWASVRAEALKMAREDLTNTANELISVLGDQVTPEIQEYIQKAINSTIDYLNTHTNSSKKNSCHGKYYTNNTSSLVLYYMGVHDGSSKVRGVYNVKALKNHFLAEFDKLCQNGGKTDTEVEAEKKAAEEKAAKEKAGYQALYNMNMKSVGSEAGVKDATVVPTSNNQYAEIQEKAQTDIINPLKNKIKEKLKNSNIPESELDRILTYAAESALSNTSAWASTSNNYTYTISSSKLIELFQDAVKSAVKSKGYDF